MSRAVRATVHLAALRHNLARVRALAPQAKVMAVVKADAYGHGLERVAKALAGADAFGVASIADARLIRGAGLKQRVVVLSGIDEPVDIEEMRWLDAETVIHHESQIRILEAARGGKPLRCWFKIDTGMHRLGFAPEQAHAMYARLAACAAVDASIPVMTHLANSDVMADPITATQIERFAPLARDLDGELSAANSAAVLSFPEARFEWVRVGGLLYGVSPIEGETGLDRGFQPAMTLSSKLIAINRVARGERVGYGGVYACGEDMDVGVVAFGYGDGYPRHARAGTPVLVRGREAPIIGRVSMDLVTVDLRGSPESRVGDPVVLWGRGLPVERIAQAAETIGYELVCGMTRRVVFVEDDAPLH
jgi:alanine racemase